MSLNLKRQQTDNTPTGFKESHNVIAMVIVVVTSFNVACSILRESIIEPLNELVALYGSRVNKLISKLSSTPLDNYKDTQYRYYDEKFA